jgi:hypothetical protein
MHPNILIYLVKFFVFLLIVFEKIAKNINNNKENKFYK